jgi:Dehydrogenases with different specificities (related to short-chain alcohol dehydrogenases)
MGADLSGRVGIVTGTSSGLGLAIANVLAESGATVIGLSRTGRVKAGEPASHANVRQVKVDLTDYSALPGVVADAAEGGKLDFLVNNAGSTVKKRAEEFVDSDFDMILDVNVKSVFKMSVCAYPYLKKSEHTGRIVSISSMAAHLGFSEVVPYCISKSAVLGITRGLAVEWANDNITVNSIAPGWFPSNMTKQVMSEERKAKILSRMPVHRFGNNADIGAMAAYLLSDAAVYITGQDFAVDGGALAFGF